MHQLISKTFVWARLRQINNRQINDLKVIVKLNIEFKLHKIRTHILYLNRNNLWLQLNTHTHIYIYI